VPGVLLKQAEHHTQLHDEPLDQCALFSHFEQGQGGCALLTPGICTSLSIGASTANQRQCLSRRWTPVDLLDVSAWKVAPD
jgi:hypothetical protein